MSIPDNPEILINSPRSAPPSSCPSATASASARHRVRANSASILAERARVASLGRRLALGLADSYPADAISLRSVTSDNFVVIDITGEERVIGEVAFPAALTELHEKAIYLHEARQYQVERMDYDGRKAYVRQVECDYYTDAIDYTQVKVLEEFAARPLGAAEAKHGDVRVNRQIVGFKKIKFYTNENVGAGTLSLPEQEMHTTSFWIHFPAAFWQPFPHLSPAERLNGLAGLGHAFRTVASLLLMCDPRDLGLAVTEEIAPPVTCFEPNLHLYDNYPGGIGQSGPLFELVPQLLAGARELIGRCACEHGCPACTGPAGETGARAKQAALEILAALEASAAGGPPHAGRPETPEARRRCAILSVTRQLDSREVGLEPFRQSP